MEEGNPKPAKRKSRRKRVRVVSPDYAQVQARVPHDVNERLNLAAERAGMSKADYMGQLLTRIDHGSIVLPPVVLAALDKWVAGQSITRSEGAKWLIQRGLWEMGALL